MADQIESQAAVGRRSGAASARPRRCAEPTRPPTKAAFKADGLGATEIAKRLKIGRASVYRVLAS